MAENFADQLIGSILAQKSYLCVGLDPQIRYVPLHIRQYAANKYGRGYQAAVEAFRIYFQTIINASAAFAACFKPQIAFYEGYGWRGIELLEDLLGLIRSLGLPAILDAKREDGGDTSEAYANAYLGRMDALDEAGEIISLPSPFDVSAITVTPWIDTPNFTPFLGACKEQDKGIFVVDKTSFKPASRLQDFIVGDNGEKAWMKLAEFAREAGKDVVGKYGYSSVGVVMGATFPQEAEIMKQIYRMCIKLVPGFKAQEGTADDAVVSVNEDGFGFVANSSRGIDYAWAPVSKSEYQCDPRFFARAVAKEAEQEREALNASVKKRIGRLPWAA